jgi:hypothetical protein
MGDLNQEWKDAEAAARNKPDLKALEAGVKRWFDRQEQHASQNSSRRISQ